MIDIHNHILFGLDDGAKTVEDSLKLIKEEISKGVSHIILTPHYKKRGGETDLSKIKENFSVLLEKVKNEQLNVEIFLGNEVYFDSDFYDSLKNQSFNSLANSNYVLLEFSMLNTPDNIPEICYEIKLKGYIPIIAHVERYECFFDNEKLLLSVLNEGAHLQVNATTVINKESKDSCKFVKFLLDNELISFVASDMHNLTNRAFYLNEAYNFVAKKYDKNYADKIFKLNQQNIITNKYFESPKSLQKRKGFLSKLFINKNSIKRKGTKDEH